MTEHFAPRYGEEHQHRARLHSRRRAAERAGWPLTDAQIDQHEDAIWLFETEILGYGGDRRKLHRINAEGGDFYAVWCPHMHCIVTYLGSPDEWRGGFLRGQP